MGSERGTRVENQGCSSGKSRNAPVMHHPRGRGVIKEPGRGGERAVQKVLLLVLKKRTCSSMDNGFGKPSRAARVENV